MDRLKAKAGSEHSKERLGALPESKDDLIEAKVKDGPTRKLGTEREMQTADIWYAQSSKLDCMATKATSTLTLRKRTALA